MSPLRAPHPTGTQRSICRWSGGGSEPGSHVTGIPLGGEGWAAGPGWRESQHPGTTARELRAWAEGGRAALIVPIPPRDPQSAHLPRGIAEWSPPPCEGQNRCPRAASTQQHRQGGINNRDACSHSSRGWRSEMEGQAGLVPSGPLSLACRGPASLCLHVVICVISSSEDRGHVGWGTTLETSFYHDHILKDPLSPNTVPLGAPGLRPSAVVLG